MSSRLHIAFLLEAISTFIARSFSLTRRRRAASAAWHWLFQFAITFRTALAIHILRSQIKIDHSLRRVHSFASGVGFIYFSSEHLTILTFYTKKQVKIKSKIAQWKMKISLRSKLFKLLYPRKIEIAWADEIYQMLAILTRFTAKRVFWERKIGIIYRT